MEKNIQDDEITLKELILKIREFVIELFRKWYVILILTIPAVAFFYYKHTKHEVTYVAETKFIIEGQGTSGMGSILSQFGIRGASGNSKTNPFKVIEVAKSKLTVRDMLFKTVEGDYIANHLLRDYELIEKWSEKKPEFKGFKFTNDQYLTFTPLENRVLLSLISKVIGSKTEKNPILGFNYDEDSGIFKYTITTKKEDLSLQILDESYKYLVNFFENDVMATQGNTTDILRAKADSLKTLIDRKIYQISRISDQSQGLILQTPNVQKTIIEGDLMALKTAYGEVLKSYEISDAGMRDTKAMFLKLDEPIPPLEPLESSLLISLIKGILLGGLLGASIVIFMKIIRDAMA
jgi:hypothetical protein